METRRAPDSIHVQVRAMLLALVAASSGCGDDGASDAGPGDAEVAADARVDGAVDAGPALDDGVEPTDPPALSCPEGWREIAAGVPTCDPWPESGFSACEGAEAHFPGTPGCARVGSACPAAGAPEGIPDGPRLHVREGSAGDGTPARPFGTVQEALAVAAAGDVVVVESGTYRGPFVIPAGVTVWGACADGAVLTADDFDSFVGNVSVGGEGAVLGNLRIEGERIGVSVGAGSLELRGVVIEGTAAYGLRVHDGGAVTGSGVVIRRTRADDFGSFGHGIRIESPATAELERVVLDRTTESAALVEGDGAVLTLRDAVVRGTRPKITRDGEAIFGHGVRSENLARVVLERVVVEDNLEVGVFCVQDGRAELTDAVVRRTAEGAGFGGFGEGLGATFGGVIALDRVLVEDNTSFGAYAHEGVGTEISGRDVVVRGTRPDGRGFNGAGVVVAFGAAATLERVAVLGNRLVGFYAQDVGSTLRLDHAIARDTDSEPTRGVGGRGLHVRDGAECEVDHATFDGNRGVSLSAAGATLRLRQLRVLGARPDGDGRFGYGLQATAGATVELDGASAFHDSLGVGLVAFDAGTTITASGLRVLRTGAQACVPGCEDALGYGLVARAGAHVAASDFRLEDSATAALQIEGGGTAALRDGAIRATPVAFNIQTDGFDDAELRAGVTFAEVGAEVDLGAYPTPVGHPPVGIDER